jgi:hypothetical protein
VVVVSAHLMCTFELVRRARSGTDLLVFGNARRSPYRTLCRKQCASGKIRCAVAYDLQSYGAIYAYGDTPEDAELLQLADRQFYRGVEIVEGKRRRE